MSHTATNHNFVDNGAGQCWHCGKPETEHPPAGWDRAEPGPEQAERWGIEIVLLALAYIAAPEGEELEDRLRRTIDRLLSEDSAERLLSALPAVFDITPESVRQALVTLTR